MRWQWIRNFWFRVAHQAAMLDPAFEMFTGIDCPLTIWEIQLLEAAGQNPGHRSFVGRLLDAMMFCDLGDNSWVWWWIYGGLAALFVLTFVLAPPRWRSYRNSLNRSTSGCRSISSTTRRTSWMAALAIWVSMGSNSMLQL
jgi:hypothetical protein